MASIPFDTLDAADARSRALWTTILGREKREQDVTEYLYGRNVDEETGDVTLEIPQRDEYLDRLLRADQMTADEIAALVELYPDYATNTAYAVDSIVAYDGLLYRVVQAHTSQATWQPDRTPALYTPATPDNVIGIWKQPLGSFDSYNLGALVTYQGSVWRSTINANVWPPGTGALWEVVE